MKLELNMDLTDINTGDVHGAFKLVRDEKTLLRIEIDSDADTDRYVFSSDEVVAMYKFLQAIVRGD